MSRRPVSVLFVLAAAFLLAPAVGAGPAAGGSQTGAVIVAHMAPHSTGSLACSSAPDMDCSEFTGEWPVRRGCDVWFVVAHANTQYGIAGASFGLAYDQPASLTQYGHVVCADLYYPNRDAQGHLFPDSGGGVRMVWDPVNHCQRTGYSSGGQANLMAVYMYAYAPGQLQITENKNLMMGPEFVVVDCDNAESDLAWPEAASVVGFGGEAAYSPCGSVEPPPPPPPSGSQANACIVAHVAPHSTGSLACSSAPDMECSEFTGAWPVRSGCDVWFVVAHAGSKYGIAGASFGLEYDQPASLTQFGHVVCTDLYYPNSDAQGHLFPDSGGVCAWCGIPSTTASGRATPAAFRPT